MALIKTTEEIRKYLKVDISEKESSFLPYVPDATEKYIKQYLGSDQLTELDEYYNDGEGEEDELLNNLLIHVQRALAKFTFLLAAPMLDLNISEGGFTVRSTQNQAPASRERVERFMQSLERQAWDNIEMLLAFLEENKDDYPLWADSDAYTMAMHNFINSAAEFDRLVPIGSSRLTFIYLRPAMDNVELTEIEPNISTELSAAIKEQMLSGELSEANEKILPNIKRAVANFTFSKIELKDMSGSMETTYSHHMIFNQEKREEYKRLGKWYLGEVIKTIEASPDDYPEYMESDLYDPTSTSYENTQDSGIFIAGTP